jgi:hypothetical protein
MAKNTRKQKAKLKMLSTKMEAAVFEYKQLDKNIKTNARKDKCDYIQKMSLEAETA